MKICIAGKNNIAVYVLHLAIKYLPLSDILVLPNSYVPENSDWQLSLKQAARELGVRQVKIEEVYSIVNLLFLSVEYSDLIKPSLFASKNLINIHFSNLPQYKGVHTSVWPIINGESQAGVTLHRIAPGIDTGEIVAQRLFNIEIDYTSRDLYFKYMEHGYEMIRSEFESLLQNNYELRAQTVINSTYYSRYSINYNKIELNFKATGWQLHNSVRAFCFPEYQLPQAFGWKIRGSELTQQASTSKPGTVISEDEQRIIVATIDYNVCLFKDYSIELFAAVMKGDNEVVKNTAQLTHNINITNSRGWSALMIAVYNNHNSIVQELINAGADINQVNLNGTSVFMYAKDGAIASGSTSLLSILLHHGANINWRDKSGKTVLDYCRINKNEKMTSFLLSQGAR